MYDLDLKRASSCPVSRRGPRAGLHEVVNKVSCGGRGLIGRCECFRIEAVGLGEPDGKAWATRGMALETCLAPMFAYG